jgi:hypothetical protein
MENVIKERGFKISESYYANNVFFRQLTLLSQSVVNILLDKNMNVKYFSYGKQYTFDQFDWVGDQGFVLPYNYKIHFLYKTGGNENFEASKTHYFWSLCFSCFNPEGNTSWVPFGFFARVERKEPGPLPDKVWKIADTLRPIVVNHDRNNSVHQVFGINEWPLSLQGEGGSDDLSKIITVPFPLAAISTSENLPDLVKKALSALKNENGSSLQNDTDYLQKYWGLFR